MKSGPECLELRQKETDPPKLQLITESSFDHSKMQAEWRARKLKNEKVNDHSQGRAIYSKSYTGKCKTSP
jgi:hypothetical protein